MSNVYVTPRNIFGLSSRLDDNFCYVDDETVAYVSGHRVVLYNIFTKRQIYFEDDDISGSISGFHSRTGKRIAVVSTFGHNNSIILFDLKTLKKKKVIKHEIFGYGCTSLQLTDDEKTLIALSKPSNPNQTLTVWTWNKSKLDISHTLTYNTVDRSFHKIILNTVKNSTLCILGTNIVQFYSISETNIKLTSETSLYNETPITGTWLTSCDDHIAVSTTKGDILIFGNTKLLFRIPPVSTSTNADNIMNYTCTSLCCYNRMLVAGTNQGTIQFYKYQNASRIMVANNIQFACELHNENVTTLATMATTTTNSTTATTNNSNSIYNMIVNANMTQLAYQSEDGQFYTISIQNKVEDYTNESIQYLFYPLHISNKAIVSLDICSRNPLLVTYSKDQTLKFWSYKSHTLLFSKEIMEDIYTVTLHPTGLQLVISYHDKVRIYHILMDDIKLCMEISLKGCKEVKFSPGGRLLALAHGSMICIIDFYTGEKINDLRGHNSKVRGLYWSDNGMTLYSCGQEGAVYLWDIYTGKRLKEHLMKGNNYSLIISASHVTTLLLIANENKIIELNKNELYLISIKDLTEYSIIQANIIKANQAVVFSCINPTDQSSHILTYPYPFPVTTTETEIEIEVGQEISSDNIGIMRENKDQNTVISSSSSTMLRGNLSRAASKRNSMKKLSSLSNMKEQLSPSNKKNNTNNMSSLFDGVNTNSTTSISLEGGDSVVSLMTTLNNRDVYNTAFPVVCARMTIDEQFYVIGDENGAITLYEIHDSESYQKRKLLTITPELISSTSWCEDILISRNEWIEYDNCIHENTNQIEELQLDYEYQLKLKESTYMDKLKVLVEDHHNKLEIAQKRVSQLKSEYNDMEIQGQDDLKKMRETYEVNTNRKELEYQKELLQLGEQIKTIQQRKDALIQSIDEQKKKLLRDHEKKVKKVTIQYDRKLQDETQMNTILKDENQTIASEIDYHTTIYEDEIDDNIESMKRQYEEKVEQYQDTVLKYKGEIGVMHKKIITHKSEIEVYKQEIIQSMDNERIYHDQVVVLEKEVALHRKEILSRDTLIEEKEKKIYELKKKHQELEKFKFVLDFKVKELKEQIEPKEEEIIELKQKIKNHDIFLAEQHQVNMNMDSQIGHIREEVNTWQNQLNNIRLYDKKLENNLCRFQTDLSNMVSLLLSPAELRVAVQQLIDTHGPKGNLKPLMDPDVEREYLRHRNMLRQEVKKIQSQYQHVHTDRVESNASHLKKNMTILTQIKSQKQMNNELKKIIQEYIGKIRKNNTMVTQKIPNTTTTNNANNQGVTNDSNDITGIRKLRKKSTLKLIESSAKFEFSTYPEERSVLGGLKNLQITNNLFEKVGMSGNQLTEESNSPQLTLQKRQLRIRKLQDLLTELQFQKYNQYEDTIFNIENEGSVHQDIQKSQNQEMKFMSTMKQDANNTMMMFEDSISAQPSLADIKNSSTSTVLPAIKKANSINSKFEDSSHLETASYDENSHISLPPI